MKSTFLALIFTLCSLASFGQGYDVKVTTRDTVVQTFEYRAVPTLGSNNQATIKYVQEKETGADTILVIRAFIEIPVPGSNPQYIPIPEWSTSRIISNGGQTRNKIIGIEPDFVTPDIADQNAIISSTGSNVFGGSSNSIILCSNGGIINSDFSTILGGTFNKTNASNSVVMGNWGRSYLPNSVVNSADRLHNIIVRGEAQEQTIWLTDTIQCALTQQTYSIGSVTLDTMAKGYTIEVLGMMVIREPGDQSFASGDTYTEKEVWVCHSDGSTATLGGSTSLWALQESNGVFIGANFFNVTQSGNTLTFICDPGDQIGGTVNTTFSVSMNIKLTELSFAQY